MKNRKCLLFHFILIDEAAAQTDYMERTIQYGYRKWGTRAQVFSQTLAHGNSKNEIR